MASWNHNTGAVSVTDDWRTFFTSLQLLDSAATWSAERLQAFVRPQLCPTTKNLLTRAATGSFAAFQGYLLTLHMLCSVVLCCAVLCCDVLTCSSTMQAPASSAATSCLRFRTLPYPSASSIPAKLPPVTQHTSKTSQKRCGLRGLTNLHLICPQ